MEYIVSSAFIFNIFLLLEIVRWYTKYIMLKVLLKTSMYMVHNRRLSTLLFTMALCGPHWK